MSLMTWMGIISEITKENGMASKETTPLDRCPHWSALSMKCRICKDGLFIPLDSHIEIYCKTPEYPQCLQYSLHTTNLLDRIKTTRQLEKNRRKFKRFEANYKITLVKLIHSGAIVTHSATVAETLDLSSAGMRVTTNKALFNDAELQFSFDTSFPEELQNCTGQVAWCNKEIDTHGYQAGICFHDDRTISAMRRYLGLSLWD